MTAIRDNSVETAVSEVTRLAGRGTIFISAAKLWFFISGAVIHLTLPRLLSGEEFGNYLVVVGIVSVINAVVIIGASQTISKYVSQEPEKADSVKLKGLQLQAMVGGGLSVVFFALAGQIARLLSDPGLTGLLRIASFITLSYSFYAVFIGYLNGRTRFLAQAAIDATYSTIKVIFIVSLVWLGFGVRGGIAGFALAAAGVLVVAVLVAGSGGRKGSVLLRDLFSFQGYLILSVLVLNLLQRTDLFLVKALSGGTASEASLNAGTYGAALTLGYITYQVVASVTQVAFPLVSQATFEQDRARARRYVSSTLRYTLLIMTLVATLFSANASEVLFVVYPAEYQEAATAFAIVSFGLLFFGILHVLTTMISASGRPSVFLKIGLFTLGLDVLLNAVLIPAYGITGAAIATTVAMISGASGAAGYVLWQFGGLLSILTVARIVISAAVIYVASVIVQPSTKLMIITQLIVFGGVYIGMLVMTREIGKEDFEAIKKTIRG